MWDCQYFHKMFMYVLQKFLKVNHTFKHIHLIMENTILSNIFCSKHSIICRLSFPSNTRSCRSWLKYNYKEKGHMPRFLLKTNTWQKKEEMNVESWGDNTGGQQVQKVGMVGQTQRLWRAWSQGHDNVTGNRTT